MQSFKFFLTIAVFLCLSGALSTVQGKEPPKPPAYAEAGDYIGYVWPYDNHDLDKDLGSAPIVLELFTAQGCMYCPVADRFFADLLERNPAIIGLAYHVTYRDVQKGSFGMNFSTTRQFEYVKNITGSTVYVPQLVINGQFQTSGAKYSEVYEMMKKTAAAPPQRITVKTDGENLYALELPILNRLDEEKATITIMQYQKPIVRKVAEGVNVNQQIKYARIVSSITPVTTWTPDKKTLNLEIIPEENSGGAVVMLQNAERILAVADIQF